MTTPVSEITRVSQRYLDGKTLTERDVYGALSHVRYVEEKQGSARASNWLRLYVARFKKFGIELPPVTANLRSWRMKALARRLPRGLTGPKSTRPAYCTHLERRTCSGCPARVWRGFDCQGHRIGVGPWGDPNSPRLSFEAPASGSRSPSLDSKPKEGSSGLPSASDRQERPAPQPAKRGRAARGVPCPRPSVRPCASGSEC